MANTEKSDNSPFSPLTLNNEELAEVMRKLSSPTSVEELNRQLAERLDREHGVPQDAEYQIGFGIDLTKPPSV